MLRSVTYDDTSFSGGLTITPELTLEQREYLQLFAFTRRMKRFPFVAEKLADPKRIAAGLPIGVDGEFYTGSTDPEGQDWECPSVVQTGTPPTNQPSVWCQWTVSQDGDVLEWDQSPKFHEALPWLKYLIETFYKPWGRRLDGVINLHHNGVAVERIVVRNNEIIAKAINDGSPFGSRYEDQ